MLIEFFILAFVVAFVAIAVLGHVLVAMAMVRKGARGRHLDGPELAGWLQLSTRAEPEAAISGGRTYR